MLFGSFSKKARVLETNSFVAILNLLGCIALFFYSLLFLGGLCPGCTIYYVLSLLAVVIFWKSLVRPVPHFLTLCAYGVVALIILGGAYFYNQDRFNQQDQKLAEFVENIRQRKIFDESALDSSYQLLETTDGFDKAPLKITLLSDFQCPYCKLLGREIQKLSGRYQGKLGVRYLFYPLDSKCNEFVSSEKHPFACKAAVLSMCANESFAKVHDDIYDNQEKLSDKWLLNKAEELNIKECYQDPKTLEKLKGLIKSAGAFDISGAPTMFINGRKLDGFIPAKALIAILDSFLANP